jgi:putative NADH-flavin reductase
MRIALLGATGRAGGAVMRQCRAAGYEVQALARRPDAIANTDEGVTTTAGDVRDLSAVSQVISGAEAVVSAIGGTKPTNLAVLDQGTAAILTAMSQHGVRRLIVIQGFHLPWSGDPGNFGQQAMNTLLRVWKRQLHPDTYRMAHRLRGSELDWTLIRMPRLTAGPPDNHYQIGSLALGPWSRVTKGQVAHFTLDCIATGEYVHAAPMIAAGWQSRRDAPRTADLPSSTDSARRGEPPAGRPPTTTRGARGIR